MDVIKDLLRPKLKPSEVKQQAKIWETHQHTLIKAFLQNRGLHRDEKENFDSYLKEIIGLLREHVKLRYLDLEDQLHTIEVLEAHYVLPYEEKVGVDSPERALLRNHYECEVHGVVRYRILVKKSQTETILYPASPQLWEDEVHDKDVLSYTSQGDKPSRKSSIPRPDIVGEEIPEEDEEDEEEDEEEEEEEEEDENEDENEDAEPEPEEEGEEEEEEGKFDELTPSVGESRHTAVKPAFFIQKDDYSQYSEIIHEAQDSHHIMNVPVWLRSRVCWLSTPFREPYLQGKPYLMGYNYLVNRNFKLCPYEEFYVNDRVFALKSDKVEIRCKFLQASKRFRTNCTLKFTLEKPKFKKGVFYRPPRFMLEIPHESPKTLCPVTVLAMAYGWSPPDFVRCVHMFLKFQKSPIIDMFLMIVGLDVEECRTQADAIRRMSHCLSRCRSMVDPANITSYVSFALRGEFLPNLVDLKTHDNGDHTLENRRKGYALAEVVAELIQLSDVMNSTRGPHQQWLPQDRRSYTVKRIDTPGEKLTFLARKYIKHFAKKGSSNLKKAVDTRRGIDLKAILNQKMIKLTNSVKNGIWDSKSDANDANQNKTQMMITGFCSDAFHMQVQKIVKYAMKKNNNAEPLITHPTQTGRVDLYITPESDRCGIMRNKALGCWITPLVDSSAMIDVILRLLEDHREALGWVPLTRDSELTRQRDTIVKDCYGGVMGWVAKPYALYQLFRKYRRKCVIWPWLGLEWDRKRNLFYFCCDEGRMTRPLIVLDRFLDLMHSMSEPSFLYHADPVKYLMERGIIEYLDASEEHCGLVLTADSLEHTLSKGCIHTHMEIHGVFSLSITVAKAFCNFNQGPRRMYTGNMEKRSLGLKIYEDRGTTVSYSLCHGQDPLMSDPVDEVLGLRHREPNGMNVVVAVLSDKVNIEDSYVVNRASLDNGMGRSTETMVTISGLGSGCVFQKPSGRTQGKAPPNKYDHLNPDGTPISGRHLAGGTAVIGKVFQKKEGSELKKRCVSRFLPWHVDYKVKRVDRYPESPSIPPKIIRVSLTKTNIPSIGDKFYMKHGQKGTISESRSPENMDWIVDGPMAGRSPDLLINVCALSRITQGLMLEILWGQARALDPVAVAQYQTMFLSSQTFDEKQRICSAVMQEHGLDYTGKVNMRKGTTGRLVKCQIFVGLVYLKVLKHMAKDKLRSRDRGPVNQLTRQTTTGRKNYGGQKQGEMENWNLYCYGMAATFQNINHECADKFMMYYCTRVEDEKTGRRCNRQALGCIDTGFYYCLSCKTGKHVVRIPNTYITNLTFQELYTAGFGHTIVARPLPSDAFLPDEAELVHQYQKTREQEREQSSLET